ncbi:MAG: hypothetical protein WBE30_14350, partial [Candidatus Cybelea sp.]
FTTRLVQNLEPVIVNGSPGIVSWLPNGEPLAILGFVVTAQRIREIYIISRPDRVHQALSHLGGGFRQPGKPPSK